MSTISRLSGAVAIAAAAVTLQFGIAHAAPTPSATVTPTAAPTPKATAAQSAPTVSPSRTALSTPTPTAAAAPRAGTAIEIRWAELGGARGPLADVIAPEYCGLPGSGCGRQFRNGFIFFSPATGAHPVWGALLETYARIGYERSGLGYPLGAEYCGLRGGGCIQGFQRGYLYFSPATGAHAVWGKILDAYAAAGYERSPLGYPIGGEQCGLRDGGCIQRFQGGFIYFSPATGAHVVWGMMLEGYRFVGFENSPLRYPLGGEVCGLQGGGCIQGFQGGYVYWSPGSGSRPVWGAILDTYRRIGFERSPLGYPVGLEFCGLRDGGCGQKFQAGSIYWSARSGAHPVRGAILHAYERQGWERGGLGYPTSSEGPVVNGTITQHFQGGRLVYHTATGVVDNGAPPAAPAAVGGETCIASHYYEPQPTASGEWFDPSKLTAAHKTAPLGSYMRVTNLANGRTIDVRINDRGPYVSGRCIDLSTASFSAIGNTSSGLMNVRVQQL